MLNLPSNFRANPIITNYCHFRERCHQTFVTLARPIRCFQIFHCEVLTQIFNDFCGIVHGFKNKVEYNTKKYQEYNNHCSENPWKTSEKNMKKEDSYFKI